MQVWRVDAERLVTVVIMALEIERPPHCVFEKNSSKLVSSVGYEADIQLSMHKLQLLMVWGVHLASCCTYVLCAIFGLFQLLIVQNKYSSKVLKHLYLNFSLPVLLGLFWFCFAFFGFFFGNYIYWRNEIH